MLIGNLPPARWTCDNNCLWILKSPDYSSEIIRILNSENQFSSVLGYNLVEESCLFLSQMDEVDRVKIYELLVKNSDTKQLIYAIAEAIGRVRRKQ